jgi:epoxyqueuosine reductase
MDRETLKTHALMLGFDAVGVCAVAPPPHYEAYQDWLANDRHASMKYLESRLRSDPRNLLPGANSIIAVALNYNQANPLVPGQPRIARYALGRDYHKVLRSKLKKLVALLPKSASRICVDSAPILEREFAHLAGLGWFGKNTCLIDSRRGSWFFIGLVLTTLEIEPDSPALGGCGTCTKCVDACPTGAIVFEGHWQVDARRCISYQTIEHPGPHTVSTHGWTFGCDICQEVCPFNQPRPSPSDRGLETREADFLSRRKWPSLQQLAVIDAEVWDQISQGSPVRRAGLEGIRRNAAANLEI